MVFRLELEKLFDSNLLELMLELRFDSFLLCWNNELCFISEFSFDVELLNLLLLRDELRSFELNPFVFVSSSA